MAKVSIIIPAYNSEKYIEKCLNSILGQSMTDFEIVVVNDGSTDSTGEILQKYHRTHPERITIIEQENMGQAKSRNKGLEVVTGEYVSFVDSDDHIHPDMLKELYEKAKEKDSDVAICDYIEIRPNQRVEQKGLHTKFDLKEAAVIAMPGPCNKLFKTSFLKKEKFQFLEGHIYEDLATIPPLLSKANSVAYVEKPLYFYLIHAGSTMQQTEITPKMLDIFQALEEMEKGFEKKGNKEECRQAIEFMYIFHLLHATSLRFLDLKDGKETVLKIQKLMKEKFPKWARNKYFKKQPIPYRAMCHLLYRKQYFIIKILREQG